MKLRRIRAVKAQEFILEDSAGKERAALRTDDGNTVLQFKDAHGNVRMFLQLDADGTPLITLEYANGQGSIQIEANDVHNCAGVVITGPSGSAQVVLGMAEGGEPAIGLVDKNGQIRFRQVGCCATGETPAGFDWDSMLWE